MCIRDSIVDLSRNEYLFEDAVKAKRSEKNSIQAGVDEGISIDGSFNDWESNANIKADSNDSFNSNADILGYANLTDSNGDTFYYINVEETILGGTNFTDESARIKGANSPALDFEVQEGTELRYPAPVVTNMDQIFILIDTDSVSYTHLTLPTPPYV